MLFYTCLYRIFLDVNSRSRIFQKPEVPPSNSDKKQELYLGPIGKDADEDHYRKTGYTIIKDKLGHLSKESQKQFEGRDATPAELRLDPGYKNLLDQGYVLVTNVKLDEESFKKGGMQIATAKAYLYMNPATGEVLKDSKAYFMRSRPDVKINEVDHAIYSAWLELARQQGVANSANKLRELTKEEVRRFKEETATPEELRSDPAYKNLLDNGFVFVGNEWVERAYLDIDWEENGFEVNTAAPAYLDGNPARGQKLDVGTGYAVFVKPSSKAKVDPEYLKLYKGRAKKQGVSVHGEFNR